MNKRTLLSIIIIYEHTKIDETYVIGRVKKNEYHVRDFRNIGRNGEVIAILFLSCARKYVKKKAHMIKH